MIQFNQIIQLTPQVQLRNDSAATVLHVDPAAILVKDANLYNPR